MSLEIQFKLAPAIIAGLNTKVSVADYRDVGAESQEIEMIMQVPGLNTWVRFDTYVSEEFPEVTAGCTANKWGNIYLPLTQFLKTNNIKWSEI